MWQIGISRKIGGDGDPKFDEEEEIVTGNIKIGDWVSQDLGKTMDPWDASIGTIAYMSPERIETVQEAYHLHKPFPGIGHHYAPNSSDASRVNFLLDVSMESEYENEDEECEGSICKIALRTCPLSSEDRSTYSIEKRRLDAFKKSWDEPLEEIEALKHEHRRELHLHGAKEVRPQAFTLLASQSRTRYGIQLEWVELVAPTQSAYLSVHNYRVTCHCHLASRPDKAMLFSWIGASETCCFRSTSLSDETEVFNLTGASGSRRSNSTTFSDKAEVFNLTRMSGAWCSDLTSFSDENELFKSDGMTGCEWSLDQSDGMTVGEQRLGQSDGMTGDERTLMLHLGQALNQVRTITLAQPSGDRLDDDSLMSAAVFSSFSKSHFEKI
ncbi:hypothetical protein CRG98_041816 [Punica granatum]|uniref:Protein kinase domain-containing protein n=1 Tax=Punica granatum TaxID=22663 RepID=A0A2I0I1H2_PUNGR|nr:hypothetical protein CRG98_041816 [Punica granatum]